MKLLLDEMISPAAAQQLRAHRYDGCWRSRGSSHLGVVIVSSKRFPQGRGSLGSLVVSLARLLDDGAPYESFVGWLD